MTTDHTVTGEVHTPFYCAHPYYGFVCRPNAVLDFSEKVPKSFGHGAHAVIDSEGFRNDDLWPAAKPRDEIRIGLFGGSVAFSVASTSNATTINAFLERELNTRRQATDGRRVVVRNFALPAGQQPQQAIIFMLHAAELDGVITFDGINEAIVAPYYNGRDIPDHFPWKPVYEVFYGRTATDEQNSLSWAIEEAEAWGKDASGVLKGALRMVAQRRIARLRDRLHRIEASGRTFRSTFPSGGERDAHEWTQVGVARWSNMIRCMKAICDLRGVDALFAVQPVPERKKMLTPEEREAIEAYPDMINLRCIAYPQLQNAVATLAADGIECMPFEDVFQNQHESIYTDHIHFEDRGCEIVAGRMADIIMRRWRCLQ